MNSLRKLWRHVPDPVRVPFRAARLGLVRLFAGSVVSVPMAGRRFLVAYRDYHQFRAARRFRRFEPEFLEAFERELPRARCVYDIGGFIGLYALTAATAPHAPRVCVFEPDAANLAAIRRNLDLNGMQTVCLRHCAVGDRNGTVAMTRAHGSTTSVATGATAHPTDSVPVVTVDGIVAQGEMPPDLVKIDVEGFELRVLQGMRETLRRHCPVVLMELHPDFLRRFGDSEDAVAAFMQAAGYSGCLLRAPGLGARTTHRQKHVIYRAEASAA